MYEPRRDKIGQLLATAVVDFAEYGVVKDGLIVSVPMNCKRTFSNTSQPMLFLKIQAFEKNNRVRSSGDSLVREGSTEMNEETESVSITDDDFSSSNGSSNPHKEVLYADSFFLLAISSLHSKQRARRFSFNLVLYSLKPKINMKFLC